MKNIKSIIELFLKHVPSQDILRESVLYDNLSLEHFIKLALPYMREYMESELRNIYAAVKDMITAECEKHFLREYWAVGLKSQPLNLFGLLLLAVERLLRFECKEVVCHYPYLMDWRQLTVTISEDTFTTAFCAIEDLKLRKRRYRFDWPTVIRHDNFYLNKLLQQELSDNHFHLWASSPHFNLSWIRIMNDTDNPDIRRKLGDLNDNKQNVNQAYYQGYRENQFEILYLQAALIRLYLYSWISGKEISLWEYYLQQYDNQSILEQIEEGLKPGYRDILRRIEWEDEEREDQSWLLLFQKMVEEESIEGSQIQKYRDIRSFLKRLEEKEIEIPFPENEERVSFWNCMEEVLRRGWSKANNSWTKKRIPLYVWEPILREKVYAALWRRCTYETVKLWTKDEAQLQLHSRDIQLAINALKRGRGLKEKLDYVLWDIPARDQIDNEARWELCGERCFLYRMFQRAYQGNEEDKKCLNLFYAYLVIKENLRSELIQSNGRIGFQNFQRYDRRKKMLIAQSSLENVVLKLAIKDTLSNPSLKHLEVRIVPKDTVEGNVSFLRQITVIDHSGEQTDDKEAALQNLSNRYYFVFHFTKSVDDTPKELYGTSCRHERKRALIRKQACCITGLRERFPMEAKRVLGIDACSSEIGCRPEVFAQAFRYLKNHCVSDKWKNNDERNLPQLRVTYHVGEDFLDIVDGMRAIDEAVHFMNLNCGDRLGHALALGIDVKEYYKMKHNVVSLSKQDYLDNLAWIYDRITKYRLGMELNDLRNFVEKEFSKYFGEVYGNLAQRHNYNIRTYFSAWGLRGDKPDYYKFGKFDQPVWQTRTEGEYQSYDSYAMNYQYPKDLDVREVETVAYLYHAYHYDKEVKIRGEEKGEFIIPECWIEGIERLQKMLQREIAFKGISIESNPTSNYMISVLDSYENHPIVKWYNNHLIQDPVKLADCPQLSVSINTDDKGCFSTSLENEYALMACALERAKDENGWALYSRTMIYEWLDEIRKMGNLQSFQEDKGYA